MNELSLFNNFFNEAFATSNYGLVDLPKVDVSETQNAYKMQMDLPGLSENDVNLELDKNVLTIASASTEKADKTSEHEENGKKWIVRERKTTSFKRRFSLPDDIDGEKISANLKNGVLFVNIPRKEVAAPKHIEIKLA